ncbi:GlxA family transcriptional regulator [Microvirga sp. VF16]|uniref:GlxA family transcriptional regulator n=1 Tax=Microvirga sp. VF16 TaxID=2807101 RepID=UPI00193CF5E1|nr:GlxA family transcriptional regulator [Microvirga sp. VF16]QRM34620.1 GlxA family transcriptional regulator [Microvirga sp. VF16]
MEAKPRLILFLAYEGMGLLDLTGPQTVFWSASEMMRKEGRPGYVRQTVSLEGGLVRTAEGTELRTTPIGEVQDFDTIIVPGSLQIEAVLEKHGLIEWLKRASHRARRTASVCAGAFLLAEAGLLDGRRAVTHWAMCDDFASRYPQVDVDSNAIFVRQDPIWTSAGVSAGIDLALALVQEDCGRDVAMQVARQLVIYVKRPGGQSQFSEILKVQSEDTDSFEQLNLWIEKNLNQNDLTVERLAEQARMSPRNFARRYKERTGRTPAKAVEILRLEAAKRMLETSPQNVDHIARSCGFGDEEHMRVTFQRHLGVSPRDYRRRFSTIA